VCRRCGQSQPTQLWLGRDSVMEGRNGPGGAVEQVLVGGGGPAPVAEVVRVSGLFVRHLQFRPVAESRLTSRRRSRQRRTRPDKKELSLTMD
jgi:hypothetical protein